MERGTYRIHYRKGEIPMRYDEKVLILTRIEGSYDEKTGNYAEDTYEEKEVFGAVSNTTDSMMQIVYGQLNQGSITIHLQNHYKKPFDLVEVRGKRYKVDNRTLYKVKEMMVLSEVK